MGFSIIDGGGGAGTVSRLLPSTPLPMGNADTITNALGPWNKGPGSNASARKQVYQAASTGFFTYNEPSCSGAGIGGPGIGTGLVSAGLGAVPIVGGVLKNVFGIFGAHHAAAVKTEQATLCQAVPDANNFLRGIDAALAQGQIDIPTAIQAMEQGYQSWRAEVKGILQDTGGHCNAACVYEKTFRAAIEFRKQNYALITASANAGSQGVLGGVTNALSGAVSAGSQIVGKVAAAFGFPSTAPAVGTVAADPSVGGGGAVVGAYSGVAQAALVPASGPSMTGVLLIGGLLLSAVVFFNLLGGKK